MTDSCLKDWLGDLSSDNIEEHIDNDEEDEEVTNISLPEERGNCYQGS